MIFWRRSFPGPKDQRSRPHYGVWTTRVIRCRTVPRQNEKLGKNDHKGTELTNSSKRGIEIMMRNDILRMGNSVEKGLLARLVQMKTTKKEKNLRLLFSRHSGDEARRVWEDPRAWLNHLVWYQRIFHRAYLYPDGSESGHRDSNRDILEIACTNAVCW